MSTRGNGRILKQKLSPFLYVAYYHNGKEQREVARHRRTGKKLIAAVDANGALIRDDNYDQAEKYLKHRIAEVITEQHGGPAFITPQAQRVTVNELLDDLVAEYKLGGKRGIPREVSPQMLSHLQRVRDFFGEMRAATVSKRHTEEFISALKAECKQNTTINRSTQLLSQAFRIAAAADPPKVPRPLKIRKLDESGNVRKGRFIQAETEAVASSLPEYMADAARFAYGAGTRAGEILKLRWPYVEGDAIVVPAADTKNREGHTIVITSELEEIIARRRTVRVAECDLIFHHNGKPIRDYRKCWQSACVVNGLGKFYCRTCKDEHGAYISVLDAERKCPKCGQK